MERQRRIYSLDFKLKAIELSNERGSLVSVANELNVSTDNIKRWKKEFNKGKLTNKSVPYNLLPCFLISLSKIKLILDCSRPNENKYWEKTCAPNK